MGATAPMVIWWAIPAPRTGTGAAVEPGINIINAMALAIADFKPIWTELLNPVSAASLLNLFDVYNFLSHFSLYGLSITNISPAYAPGAPE